MIHPARQILAYSRQNPTIWTKIRKAREQFSISTPYYLLVCDLMRIVPTLSFQDAETLSAVIAWQPTQGIYHFDDDLYENLAGSVTERTAVDATPLLRMPEWSVFIDTPGMRLNEQGVRRVAVGAWVALTQFTSEEECPLIINITFVYDDDNMRTIGFPLSQSPISVVDAIDQAARGDEANVAEEMKSVAAQVATVLVLALYLCREPDITQNGRVAHIPNRRAIKVKRPSASRPKAEIWDVGVRVGAEIRVRREQENREARDLEEHAATGRHMCPHTRRMHKRMVCVGPRKRHDGTKIPASMRQHIERWIPISHVNCELGDDLPAVIHRVRGEQALEAA